MSQINEYINELKNRIQQLESKIDKTQDSIRGEQLAFEHKKNELYKKAEAETRDYKGKKFDFSYKKIFDKIEINITPKQIVSELNNNYKL